MLTVQTSYSIPIDLANVYKDWKGTEPDAPIECRLFINSLLAVGLKPIAIHVKSFRFLTVEFKTWAEADEADRSIRQVLDLLWLYEDTQPTHHPWPPYHTGGAEE